MMAELPAWIAELADANAERGGHFYDEDARRFFNSQFADDCAETADSVYMAERIGGEGTPSPAYWRVLRVPSDDVGANPQRIAEHIADRASALAMMHAYADGEAYIPPEVVKKVGAKRLYSMMDKIRHARTGTKRQAPEVDPRKFLPA